jgi:hypothetical protein
MPRPNFALYTYLMKGSSTHFACMHLNNATHYFVLSNPALSLGRCSYSQGYGDEPTTSRANPSVLQCR